MVTVQAEDLVHIVTDREEDLVHIATVQEVHLVRTILVQVVHPVRIVTAPEAVAYLVTAQAETLDRTEMYPQQYPVRNTL